MNRHSDLWALKEGKVRDGVFQSPPLVWTKCIKADITAVVSTYNRWPVWSHASPCVQAGPGERSVSIQMISLLQFDSLTSATNHSQAEQTSKPIRFAETETNQDDSNPFRLLKGWLMMVPNKGTREMFQLDTQRVPISFFPVSSSISSTLINSSVQVAR